MADTSNDFPKAQSGDPLPTAKPGSPAKGKSKGILGLVVLAILLVGAAAWGVSYWTIGRFEERTNNAYIQADLVVIAPKINGYVERVLVSDNQSVAAGQPLVQIDSKQIEAALAEDRANLDGRTADLERVRADLARQPALVAQSQAQLQATAAQASYAAGDYKRYSALAASGADTIQHRDQAQSSSDQAAATFKAQQAAADAIKLQSLTLKAQLDQAQAAVDSARAQVASRELDLASTVIRSAISGRVADRTVRAGQFVQPGTRLMDVVPLEQLYLVANFKETQIARMRIGQHVTIKVDALQGKTLEGRIDSLAPGTGGQFAVLPAQNATGNFTKIVQRVPVRITLLATPETRALLLPGMSTEVTVDTRPSATGRQYD